jgi:hypothetical protein
LTTQFESLQSWRLAAAKASADWTDSIVSAPTGAPLGLYANYPSALQLHATEGKVGRTTRKRGDGAFPLVVQALASAEVDIPDCGMELAVIESPGRDTTDTRNGQKPQDVIDRTVDEIHPSK